MTEPSWTVAGWKTWLESSSYVLALLGDTDGCSPRDYFSRVHPATEAIFRRILFVGLRAHLVQFKAAEDRLSADNAKFTRKDFPVLFDRLYFPEKQTVFAQCVLWETLLNLHKRLNELWNLWLNFSKVIRNHQLHGLRIYSDEWLRYAIAIDQALIIELDTVMMPIIGGYLGQDLRLFTPRLPKGLDDADLSVITGIRKPKLPRPPISLTEVRDQFLVLPLLSIVADASDQNGHGAMRVTS